MMMLFLHLQQQQQQQQLDEEHALKMDHNSTPSAVGSLSFFGSFVIITRLIALIIISAATLRLFYHHHYQLNRIGNSLSKGLEIATSAVSMKIATSAVSSTTLRRALRDNPKETAHDVISFDVKVADTISPLERQALQDLYESTDGPNWIANNGWEFSDPNSNPCNFFGVECDGSHVSILSLSSNRLSGTIPSTIGQLTSLKSLSLGDNELRGTIPSTIGQLSSLTSLYLGDNELIGTIPSTIGQLSLNLYALSLSNNQLSGTIPQTIGQLSSLSFLGLNDNRLTGIVPFSLCQRTVAFQGNLLTCYPACVRVFNSNAGSTPVCANPTVHLTQTPPSAEPSALPSAEPSASPSFFLGE
jgi:Leucine-rich repeat (LRR) protein